jgi:hypothetical protein
MRPDELQCVALGHPLFLVERVFASASASPASAIDSPDPHNPPPLSIKLYLLLELSRPPHLVAAAPFTCCITTRKVCFPLPSPPLACCRPMDYRPRTAGCSSRTSIVRSLGSPSYSRLFRLRSIGLFRRKTQHSPPSRTRSAANCNPDE